MNATELQKRIEEKGVKKKWLADQLKVSPGMITHWLNNRNVIPDNQRESLKKLLA